MTPAVPQIEVTKQEPQPEWAKLQLSLIERTVAAAKEFVERYTRLDGSLIWRDRWPGIDGTDDPYEGFMYLALLGAISSDRSTVRLAHQMWDAITWQWTQYGQIEREYDRHYDWMHHGEANSFHYFFGLSDPSSLKARQRAARFAAMYDGTDPAAPNYDPDLGIIRASHTGSNGPLFTLTAEALAVNREVYSDYLSPFEDLATADFADGAPIDWTDDRIFAELLSKMNERLTCGDIPLNLNATGQIVHAYLYDGQEDRRQWVVDYVNRWLQRALENGGTIPDNVGPNGIVGELLDGKWWGGHYGWRWPHGWRTIIDPVLTGCLNAHLVTGDPAQLQLARLQLDDAWSRARLGEQGWEIPTKRFDSGWTWYEPMDPVPAIQLWSRSMDDEDLERVERLRIDDTWNQVVTPDGLFAPHLFLANTLPWFEFIRGRNPGYLERILTSDHDLLDQQLRRMRSPEGNPETWDTLTKIDGQHHPIWRPEVDGYAIHLWQVFSPIHVESLIHTVFGAPAFLSRGGLQFAQVRPFDPQAKVAGLPPGVAMAVTGLDQQGVDVTLAYHPAEEEPRSVLLQAGGYREHEFTAVLANGMKVPLEAATAQVSVEMHPGTVVHLRLGMRRMVHQPTYEDPFMSKSAWAPLIVGRDE